MKKEIDILKLLSRKTIPTCIIIDNTLTFEARGLLIYLLTIEDIEDINKSEVMTSANMGRTKFDRIWKELKSEGYIESEKGNEFSGWKHYISIVPTT